MRIAISSGHSLLVRGAAGIIDEVDEARRVVDETASQLAAHGHQVIVFHDDLSTTQSENLDTIVAFHNSQNRDVDVSVHFNCYEDTIEPRGTECLYVSQEALAERISAAISKAGDLVNRGAKYRDDLAFLNGCDRPAVLIEVCFVDSEPDVTNYLANFEKICEALGALPMYTTDLQVFVEGPASWFGGPEDSGVSADEGLAFIYDYDDAPHLFLDEQPAGTTGLARRLDPTVYYVACRWDYDITPKEMLADPDLLALVWSEETGRGFLAWPADWGPHQDTGRIADLSPALLDDLGLETDDEVTVIYPIARRKPKNEQND